MARQIPLRWIRNILDRICTLVVYCAQSVTPCVPDIGLLNRSIRVGWKARGSIPPQGSKRIGILMGDPRNPARAREEWNQHRIDTMDMEIQTLLCELGILSGGWAWHYMSPPHTEYKMLHDHKDIDMFVDPHVAALTMFELKQRGYVRTWTQYDDPSGQFERFEQHVDDVKIIIDLFIEEVPFIHAGSVRVVEPHKLLSYYSLKKHTTDDCTAVIAARKLIAQGIDPVGREELCQF